MDNGTAVERRSTLVIGALLIVAGLGFLVAQQLDLDWAVVGWPLFIVVPGIVLFVVGLTVGGQAGAGFAVPAGVVTMAGLVLAFQNETGLWATWAYAWALVGPGGVGLGLFLYGLLTRRPDLVEGGGATLLVGIGLFLAFAFFFESVIGLSRGRLSGMDTVFAAGLVALGVLVVVLSLVRGRARDRGDAVG